jgi:hypothetical protein
MSNLGKIGKCAICGENKRLVSGRFSEGSPRSTGYEWLICMDCQNIRLLCEICQESTILESYERHLLKHSKEELARQLSDNWAKKQKKLT